MNRRQISLQVSGIRWSRVERCACSSVRIDGEEGVGRHREGDPAGPLGVAADPVIIQPGQSHLSLQGLLHPPPGTCDLDQGGQGCGRGGVTAVLGELTGAALAADQQLVAARGCLCEVDDGPVVEPLPLRAAPG